MKNLYEIRGETTVIYLVRKGVIHESLIDTEDLEKVLGSSSRLYNFTWRTRKHKNYNQLYAGRSYRCKKERHEILMHRLILNATSDHVVDHINHNTLDNRKINLRLVTNAQNAQNKIHALGASGRQCVTWHKACKKWQAAIKLNGKNIYLGLFENIDDASEAVTRARETYMPYSAEATKKRNEGEPA